MPPRQPSPPPPDNASARVAAAQAALAAGRLPEAIAHLQRAVARDPQRGDAHFGLAELAAASGDVDTALRHYPLATALQPRDPVPPYNHGVLLDRLDRPAAAADCYAEALRRRPGFAAALNNRGAALLRLGRADEAQASFAAAIAAAPDLAVAHANLARAWQRLGRLDLAEQAGRDALRRHPTDDEVLRAWLGVRQRQGVAPATILAEISPALALPRPSPVARALAIELAATAGQLDAAQRTLAAAERDGAIDGGVLRAAMAVWQRTGRSAHQVLDAVQGHAQRLPDDPAARLALACALLEVRRVDEAVRLLDAVVGSEIGDLRRAAALVLAVVSMRQRRFRPAQDLLEPLFQADPHDITVGAVLLVARTGMADWRDYDALVGLALAHAQSSPTPLLAPGFAQGVDAFDAPRQLDLAARLAEPAAAIAPVQPRTPPLPPGAARRLRVGYLSADFREHAVAYLAVGVLERHDRTRVETFAYDISRDDGSPMRARCRAAFEHWRSFGGSDSDDALAQAIADDRLDVLVDLAGWTGDARAFALARRPAPVIVNWLGFPGTMGSRRLADVILGDALITPPAHAPFYAETIVRLPHCYQPNDDRRPIGPRPARAVLGLPEDAFVFCCFNRVEKITPFVFDLWCRLLRELPHTVLWLLAPEALAQEHLRRAAGERGVDPARLVFAPAQPHAAHLGRLQCADLVLDTFPYNAHTTGSDALWAGVPMVTRIGTTFAARVGASLLTAVGLPDLIADSDAGYLDLARRLATDPTALAAVRQRLANRASAPLFDTARFARDLEDTLVTIAAQSPLLASPNASATAAERAAASESAHGA